MSVYLLSRMCLLTEHRQTYFFHEVQNYSIFSLLEMEMPVKDSKCSAETVCFILPVIYDKANGSQH